MVSPSWKAERGTVDERRGGWPRVRAGCVRWGSEPRAGWKPAEECGCCYSTSRAPTTPAGANWRRRHKEEQKFDEEEDGRKDKKLEIYLEAHIKIIWYFWLLSSTIWSEKQIVITLTDAGIVILFEITGSVWHTIFIFTGETISQCDMTLTFLPTKCVSFTFCLKDF